MRDNIMEATRKRTAPLEGIRRFAGTRRGAVTIAAVSAALAGLMLLAFVTQYKENVQAGTLEQPALVADRLIPKGTAGSVVAADGLFRPTSVQRESLESGALTSAAMLQGKVATRDVYPGEQLTADDFAASSDPLRSPLRGTQRAMDVPIDSAHGMVGGLRSGDKVDVIAGFNAAGASTGRGRPELRTLATDILVLKAPEDAEKAKGNEPEKLSVRVTASQAAKVAFAADNGKVWFILRPPAGAKDSPPSSVTLDSLLTGAPTIEVDR
jgi:Flp pilus assembly protein CpaB